MSRIRVIALSMGLVIAALLAHSVSEAQGPGGPPGGGRGRGGFGGGFGGFGNNDLISLARLPGVQYELKLSDKQKTDVTALSEKISARRKEQFDRMREQFRGRGGPRGKADDAADSTETAKAGTGSTKSKTAAKSTDTKGKVADAKGKTGKASAKGKTAAGGNGGPGGDFRAAMKKQQDEDEAALAKILTPAQRTRLVQAKLQADGPYAFLQPDLQKKLNMTGSQADEVSAIMDQARQAQRDAGRSQNGDRGNRGNGNNGDRGNRGNGNGGGQGFGNGGFANRGPNGNNNQGGGGNRGQDGQGGNNRGQGGQGGNNRGQGGQGGGRFNPEEFQKKMQEDPQFKAEVEKQRAERQQRTDDFRNQTMQMIAGVLSKKQKVAYNKMLGDPPFDRAKLDRNFDPSTLPKEEPKSSSKKKTTKTKR